MDHPTLIEPEGNDSAPAGPEVYDAVADVIHEKGIRRDAEFYFDMVVFLVDGCLFRVPRLYFEQYSEIFQTMFTLPAGDEGEQEGSCDEKPLRLDGVAEADFRLFLKVLYPLRLGKKLAFTKEEWIPVLKLAHMWDFKNIRDKSILKLSKLALEEVEKVVLARTYDVREWFVPAYTALVKREKPLSVEEAEQLGFDFAIKMAQARELQTKGIPVNLSEQCTYCRRTTVTIPSRAPADTAEIVREIFGVEA